MITVYEPPIWDLSLVAHGAFDSISYTYAHLT